MSAIPSSIPKPASSSMDLAHFEALPTEVLARKLSFSTVAPDESLTASSADPAKMRVVVRARPLADGEVPSDMTLADNAVAMRTVKSTANGRESTEEASFFFDTVYRGTATQAEVFEGAMLPQVLALFTGRDTLTFGYGVTNAGKTYTIQGRGGADELGCIPRALEAMFAALRHHDAKRAAAKGEGPDPEEAPTGPASLIELDESCRYEVRASFLEVYGNDAFDLLSVAEANPKAPANQPTKRPVLKLKENGGQVFVEGLKEVELPDLESAVRAVQLGWQQRASASNGINFESSRSHSVLCVKLLTHRTGVDKPSTTRLCVVDLAGAERQKNTQTNGARLNEANYINKDLTVLGACLRQLRDNQKKGSQILPRFRESTITRLFRDYLEGKGQVSVIAAISPRLTDAVGTLDTLKFAAVADQVKVVQKVAPPPAAPVHLPRCAGGAGIPMPAKGGAKEAKAPELAREASSARTSSDSEAQLAALSARDDEVTFLREEVADLQERLLSSEAEKIAIERQVREEVASEMQGLGRLEAELRDRMEQERQNTEDLYYKKLELVKTASKESKGFQLQAHTDMLQQMRDKSMRDKEHEATVKRLDAELEVRKGELEAARVEIETLHSSAERSESEELAAVRAQLAVTDVRLSDERDARIRAEEVLAEAEAERKQQAIELESLNFQLATEKESIGGLQRQISALQTRCASLTELNGSSNRRASRSTKENAKKMLGKMTGTTVSLGEDAGLAPANGANGAVVEDSALGDATNVLAAEEDSFDLEPKAQRSLRRGSARSDQQLAEANAVLVGHDGKAPKPSMLRQLRGKGIFGSKKAKGGADGRDSMGDDASGIYLDIGAPTSNTPEPTPIARRTRAGRAGA